MFYYNYFEVRFMNANVNFNIENFKNIATSYINEMIILLNESNDKYCFDKCVKGYLLPDNTKIIFNYKTCSFFCTNNNSTQYKIITDMFKKYLCNSGKYNKLVKKIEERKILYKYLVKKNLLYVEIRDSEKPDFIVDNKKIKIGIEITKSISSAEAKTDRVANNPNDYINIDLKKIFKNEVIKCSDTVYMPNQSSKISDLVKNIPFVINKKNRFIR